MVLTITDLAAELGVRSDTLRFYEREGLISSAGRTPGGYRLYGSDVADRVRFIKSAQRSGLRLRDIEELLVVRDAGNCPCGHTADLVEKRLAEVDEEIVRLQSLRSSLVRLQARNDTCRTSSLDAWSCLVTTSEIGGEEQ
jgi:DNA-binding transcriptional MerR regulator